MTTTVQLSAATDLTTLACRSRNEIYLVLHVVGHGAALDAVRPMISACFVLDTSGSMRGAPLTQAVDSVARLARLLAPTDRAALVTFSANATLDLPMTVLDAHGHALLRRRLEALHGDGSTAFAQGLEAGKNVFAQPGPNERYVLMALTDGEATDGSTTESLHLFGETCRPAISIAALGYGPAHNTDMLMALAKGAGGSYHYIADPQLASVEFARALGSHVDAVADGVELWLAPCDGVEIVEVLGQARLRFGKDGVRVAIPNLRAEQPYTVVVKLHVVASPEPGKQLIVRSHVNYRATGGAQQQTTRHDCAVIVTNVSNDVGTRDATACGHVALALAAHLRTVAQSHADQQRYEAAAVLIRQAIALLEAVPGYQAVDGSALSEAVEQLVDDAVMYEKRPTATQYREYKGHSGTMDVAQSAKLAGPLNMSKLNQQSVDADVQGEVSVELHGNISVFPLQAEMTVGRGQSNLVAVATASVSRVHARILCVDGKVMICDLGSSNGTQVNGQNISVAKLGPNDVVKLGEATLRILRQN